MLASYYHIVAMSARTAAAEAPATAVHRFFEIYRPIPAFLFRRLASEFAFLIPQHQLGQGSVRRFSLKQNGIHTLADGHTNSQPPCQRRHALGSIIALHHCVPLAQVPRCVRPLPDGNARHMVAGMR